MSRKSVIKKSQTLLVVEKLIDYECEMIEKKPSINPYQLWTFQPGGSSYLNVSRADEWKSGTWKASKTDLEPSGVNTNNTSDYESEDEACCCPSDGDDGDDQELSDLECAEEVKKEKKRKNCCWQAVKNCYLTFQRGVRTIVENKYFQQALLGAILINTLSMGIEYHNQVMNSITVVKTW